MLSSIIGYQVGYLASSELPGREYHLMSQGAPMTKIGHHSYLLMCKAFSQYFNMKIINNHKKYEKVSLFGGGYA